MENSSKTIIIESSMDTSKTKVIVSKTDNSKLKCLLCKGDGEDTGRWTRCYTDNQEILIDDTEKNMNIIKTRMDWELLENMFKDACNEIGQTGYAEDGWFLVDSLTHDEKQFNPYVEYLLNIESTGISFNNIVCLLWKNYYDVESKPLILDEFHINLEKLCLDDGFDTDYLKSQIQKAIDFLLKNKDGRKQVKRDTVYMQAS